MTPTGKYVQETLLVRLKQSGQTPDLTPIHRLDRETAGVVMFCKNLNPAVCINLYLQRAMCKNLSCHRPLSSHASVSSHSSTQHEQR